jgi:hypothetical protein
VRENQQDFTMSGLEQYGEFGDYVASGDVNGDDIADIIVIAEAAGEPDKSRTNAGDAYVFFGSKSLGGTAKVAEGAQSLAIFGAEGVEQQDQRDTLGFSAASGDVNGDGFDDIILTARLAGGPGNSRSTAGEAYIIFGSASLSGTIDIAANTQDVTIYGADANDLLGYSAAHDVNGDGIDDIILGTAYADGPGNSKDGAGEAYVIFGSRTLPPVIDLALVQPDITVPGIEEGDGLGATVIGGDLNGDGRSELIAVALRADGPDNSRKDAGEVYVITVPRSD